MKKVLFIAFIVALCLCLGVGCFALTEREGEPIPYNGNPTPTEERSEDPYNGNPTPTEERSEDPYGKDEVVLSEEEKNDVKAYIMDKIVPVAVAVLTSALAFLATLGTIAKSLKALKDTKDAFSDEAKERAVFFECGMEMLTEKTEELKELVSDVPKLKEELLALSEECRLNSEILTLGFSANSDVIKSGKGKRMSVLLNDAKRKVQNAKVAAGASPRPTSEVAGPVEEVSANETV